MANAVKKSGQSLSSLLTSVSSDLLANSDFLSRAIGMNNSYDDIMSVVQSLGREPVSLLGKDYLFIFDTVKRNYNQGTLVMNPNYGIPKFTFYKDRPTIRFANPDDDPMNLKNRWFPNINFADTSQRNILFSYAESLKDDSVDNKEIGVSYDIDNANPGVNFGGIKSFDNIMSTSDILRKTNDNFNYGKYRTIIARFHTDSQDSKNKNDITQTAISEQYGMSHGRNLLSKKREIKNGYDNPYCRVWTYHHQYNQLARAIRPFGDEADTAEKLESKELEGSNYATVGFRVPENKEYQFKGGSERLDKYGVLNYRNGLVNIAPTAKIKNYFEHKLDDQITIKKCMFSIENLAWKSSDIIKDEYEKYGLSPEQKGPLGGRIMWFPPYNLTFNENVNVNWNANQFIGRGEKIYTYTDTERTGNISFTLLIDHPSILDYWTGHKRNGMTNKGEGLLPENTGGVDESNAMQSTEGDNNNKGNKSNQENTLLRFFAGCEILTAKPQEYKTRIPKPPQTKDPEPEKIPEPEKEEVVTKPQEPELVKKTSEHKIFCILYYPNNYSGRDDYPVGSNQEVNAVYYLMNGIGTQTYYDEATKTVKDIPTAVDTEVKVNGNKCGGYEMRDNGISITDENIGSDYQRVSASVVNKTYIDDAKIPNKSQYLTDSDGEKYTATYGNNTYDLTKMIGNGALPKNKAAANYSYTWLQKRFFYRVNTVPYNSTVVDQNKDYAIQVFTHVDSYVDTKSYQLNSTGFRIVYDYEELCKRLGIDKENSDDLLISFTDLFVAAENKSKDVLSGLYNNDTVELITKIFKDSGEEYKITSAKILGLASKQGRPRWNEELAKNRGLTFKKWLDGTNLLSGVEVTSKGEIYDKVTRVNVGGDNLRESKVWRCACLEIQYEQYSFENAALAEDTSTVPKEDSANSRRTSRAAQDTSNEAKNILDRTSTSSKDTSQKPFMEIREFLHGTPEGRKLLDEHGQLKPTITPDGKFLITKELDEWTATAQDIKRLTGKEYFNKMAWDYDDSVQNVGFTVSEPKTVERYDNEGEFFELLGKNDAFMHHLITNKIRYFDPAYHSVSPEGFNARLTFLHQCTRQGSTVGAGEGSFSTAYNLSFGRPPVCVLRLGDFYYTKIVINSMSITYDEPQWDLNPEGIGVMPMFANVNLGFTFLGGSDLAGPISRLQNAVSFNYYANTSVYDDRAEMVQYDSNGSGKEILFKPFAYPSMLHGGDKKDTVTNTRQDLT